MFMLDIFVSCVLGVLLIITGIVTLLYCKSASFRYIIKHPDAFISLVKVSPKDTKQKMETLLQDEALQKMLQDPDVQEEMQTKMKKHILNTSNSSKEKEELPEPKEISDHEKCELNQHSTGVTKSPNISVNNDYCVVDGNCDKGAEKEKPNEKPNEKLDQSANIPPDSFMNNPLFDQMLSNPELMLSMMPDSEEKKQMQEALKNPLFKSMLTNKELMKQMMQTAPPMNELQKKNN